MADSATHDVYGNTALTEITVVPTGDAGPANTTKIGTYDHGDSTDPLGYDGNHVLWHHIRDMLYKLKQWNMQIVKIIVPDVIPVIAVTGVSVAPTSPSVQVGKTVTLTATVTPSNATVSAVTWSSSAPEIATVDNNGVVTGVAAGTTEVSASSNNGIDSKVTVTVTT